MVPLLYDHTGTSYLCIAARKQSGAFFFCHLTGSLGGEVADFFRSQQPHHLMIHAPQTSVFYLNMISAAIRKPFSALALTQIIKTWLHSDN